MPMQSKLKAYLLLNGYNVGLYRSDLREIKKCGVVCVRKSSMRLFFLSLLNAVIILFQNQYTIINLKKAIYVHYRLKQ